MFPSFTPQTFFKSSPVSLAGATSNSPEKSESRSLPATKRAQGDGGPAHPLHPGKTRASCASSLVLCYELCVIPLAATRTSYGRKRQLQWGNEPHDDQEKWKQ